tara:strand:- start:1325 stop:1615 length:291 start_codon:yes stop_codon:yes gene_type:complete
MIFEAMDHLSASEVEHVDQLLADAYKIPLEPYSTAFLCAVKLQQHLLLDGCSAMIDAGPGLSTAQVRKLGQSVQASAPTAAEAMSLAALAWHKLQG